MTPIDFFSILMALDTMYPFSVTGGKRTKARNAKVGGDPNSRHLLWFATDIVLDDPTTTKAFLAEAKRQGLIALEEADHIHLQTP